MGGTPLGGTPLDGTPMEETVFLSDQPVAVLKSLPQQATSVYYVYADHLLTPRLITRAQDDMIVWRWDVAEPFGASAPLESPGGLEPFVYNRRFPGQVYDAFLGVSYNYFRDYDPQTGRYLQSDPIGQGGGVNTYAYVDGNPLSFYDPNGLSGLGVVGGVIGGVGGRIGGAIVGEAVFPAGGGVPGAIIGGKLGSVAGTAAGDWLNGVLMSEKLDRKASHDTYKAFQRKGYDRDPEDPCQELRNRAAYLRKLIAAREAHDAKFPNPGWPNGMRHAGVNSVDRANLARIEERIRNECQDTCK